MWSMQNSTLNKRRLCLYFFFLSHDTDLTFISLIDTSMTSWSLYAWKWILFREDTALVPRSSSFHWKNARLLRHQNTVTGESFKWRKLFQLDVCPYYCVYNSKYLPYSLRMTDRNFSSELLKLKGRQPLPQNHQNHINNMTDTSPRSFKSKWHSRSFVYEKKLLCSAVLVGFNLQSGVGLVSKKKKKLS